MKHVVIVGGGFAGVRCAQDLAHSGKVRVTLIDRHNYQQFKPLFYQVAISELTPRDVGFSLRKIFRKSPNVDIKLALLTGLRVNIETFVDWVGNDFSKGRGPQLLDRSDASSYEKIGRVSVTLDDINICDFNVYALCGDGDMMEGVASEAASIAGRLRLSNLCWIYDSNRVTIEGHTDIAFTEDVAARFMGYGWEVTRITDPNDIGMIERAYREFEATKNRPTLSPNISALQPSMS
jgi:hypothetical protein